MIRYMIDSDLDSACRIEAASFVPEDRWSRRDFRLHLGIANVIAVVYEASPDILGYCLWEQRERSFDVCTLVVDPKYRRLGIGKALLERVFSRMAASNERDNCEPRETVTFDVGDTNLGAHLFLRAMGFRAYPRGETYRFERHEFQTQGATT